MGRKLQESLLSLLSKVGDNKRLTAIRNGISITIPFTIVGSIFLIIGNLPIDAWMNFIEPWAGILGAPVNVTFGILGLLVAIGVGYHMGKELDVNPITNSAMTTVAFLLATLNADYSINLDELGASGMFTAIIISLLTVEIYRFFVKKNIVFRLPEGVPPAVSESFVSLVPTMAVIALVWVIRVVLGIELNVVIQMIFSPLVFGMNTLPGLMVYTLLCCFLWCCGIHGDNILSGIATPIFLSNLAANTVAFQAGKLPPFIVADGFWILFMCLGGTGATLGLVLAMLKGKSKLYRSLGKMSLPSALFCINEPVIFGFPIVMNPLMMIPFVLTPMVLGTGTYILMKFNIIGRIVFTVPWTIPPVIGPYLATNGNIPATIWSICTIIIAYFIYLPFFKIADNKQAAVEHVSDN